MIAAPLHWGSTGGRLVLYRAGVALLEVDAPAGAILWAGRALAALEAGAPLELPKGAQLHGAARQARFARDLLGLFCGG